MTAVNKILVVVGLVVVAGAGWVWWMKTKIPVPSAEPTETKDVVMETCIGETNLSLANNQYLMADRLSVEFKATPAAEVVSKLKQKYNLEVIQLYNQPNVVFFVNKESAAKIKCQLVNEPEVEAVFFIENRPVE